MKAFFFSTALNICGPGCKITRHQGSLQGSAQFNLASYRDKLK